LPPDEVSMGIIIDSIELLFNTNTCLLIVITELQSIEHCKLGLVANGVY
jgi:hypothetical protein